MTKRRVRRARAWTQARPACSISAWTTSTMATKMSGADCTSSWMLPMLAARGPVPTMPTTQGVSSSCEGSSRFRTPRRTTTVRHPRCSRVATTCRSRSRCRVWALPCRGTRTVIPTIRTRTWAACRTTRFRLRLQLMRVTPAAWVYPRRRTCFPRIWMRAPICRRTKTTHHRLCLLS